MEKSLAVDLSISLYVIINHKLFIEKMETLFLILGIAAIIGGLIGSVAPVLPGPLLSYTGLVCLHFTSKANFSSTFLIVWAVIAGIVFLIDYILPVWGVKNRGGTKYGIWGASIGTLVGLFIIPPFGIIIGPFLGAIIGEMMANTDSDKWWNIGIGSLIGFLISTVLKLIAAAIMAFYFVKEWLF